MKKTTLITICMILLLVFTVHAFNNKKSIVGWGFDVVWNGTGDQPPGDVLLVYNWTTLLPFIDDETQVYACKWFNNYQRWIPMRSAVKNLTENTVKFYINNMPQKWALCLLNDSATCTVRPNATSFDLAESTNLSAVNIPDLDSLNTLTLKKNSGKIAWSGNDPYDVCGSPLDDAVSTSGTHASIDKNALSTSLDSQAVVTLENIDCANYNLYYINEFYNTTAAILADPNKQLMASTGSSTCSNTSICDSVSCVGSTLTFTAKHFDGFGAGEGGGGGSPTIPEFSDYGLIFAIVLAAIGISLIVKKKK